jgi:purine-cytosine permease-like protein
MDTIGMAPAIDAVPATSVPDKTEEGPALQPKEYEREEVPAEAFKHWTSFLAIFVGRHTAGTEFSIGPLFIVHGATTFDVIVGLFIGNILATLSWRFICGPIAIKKRFTSFYLLERIVGRKVLVLYNILVGVLLAMIAGAMFAVSATAVGVLFNVPMPGLHDWFPSSWAWVGVVAAVGAVTAIVAAFGYSWVALFSKLMAPYMFGVIVYMGFECMQRLDIHTMEDFWTIANSKIWTGRNIDEGFSHYGFFHCVCSAWFCDLILHIGMSDLTILRYGKTANVAWMSAAGMFLGHYFTWIVAALLYAVQLDNDPSNTSVAPGPMANAIAGINGLVCVIVAGWSTANPVLYEAGLAFQALMGPGSRTWLVTLVVGALATLAGLFPALVMRILDFLAFGGLAIMPMGIIILLDCWVLPRLGIEEEYSERSKRNGKAESTNWPAAATWLFTNLVTLPLVLTGTVDVFFAPLLGAPLAFTFYLLGSYTRDRYKFLSLSSYNHSASASSSYDGGEASGSNEGAV